MHVVFLRVTRDMAATFGLIHSSVQGSTSWSGLFGVPGYGNFNSFASVNAICISQHVYLPCS